MVIFKLLVKSLRNYFWTFKLLKCLQRKYSPLNTGKFYHIQNDRLEDRTKSHVMFKLLVKPLKNPFWIFQAFEIFAKEIFFVNYKKILACHIGHV